MSNQPKPEQSRPRPRRELVMPAAAIARATEAELVTHLQYVVSGNPPGTIAERAHEARRIMAKLDVRRSGAAPGDDAR